HGVGAYDSVVRIVPIGWYEPARAGCQHDPYLSGGPAVVASNGNEVDATATCQRGSECEPCTTLVSVHGFATLPGVFQGNEAIVNPCGRLGAASKRRRARLLSSDADEAPVEHRPGAACRPCVSCRLGGRGMPHGCRASERVFAGGNRGATCCDRTRR